MSARPRSQNHACDTLVICRHRSRMPVMAVGMGNASLASPIGANIESMPMTATQWREHWNGHRRACRGPFASPLQPLSP